MIKYYKQILCFISVMLLSGVVHAQRVPPPVDLPIPNIQQEAEVWCWVAVAQQIIHSVVGPDNTTQQCALVAIANGAHPGDCCSGYNPQCVRTGTMQQVQFLIGHFGGRYTNIAPPTNPMMLYQTLASGRPILLKVRSGMRGFHVVVLRGMSFVQTRNGVESVLHINDPMAHFTQPVPFSRLIPIWVAAIVVN